MTSAEYSSGPLPSPTELREVAVRARRYAQYVTGHVAESRLLELADALEARAAENRHYRGFWAEMDAIGAGGLQCTHLVALTIVSAEKC